MSYDDPYNIPFGTSPLDAPGLGITPWDSLGTAVDKVNTGLLQKGVESNAQFWRKYDAAMATPGHTGGHTGGHAGAHAGPRGSRSATMRAQASVLRHLGGDQFSHLRGMAAHIDYKRDKLASARLQATRHLRRGARLAWVLAAVLIVAVLFHIQLFNANYRQVTYEFFGVRLGLLAALFCAWKWTRKVKAASTATEKDYALQLRLLRRLRGKAFGKGWIQALSKAPLTLDFIQEFNVRYKRATGKNMPFVIYRYKTLDDRRACLIPATATLTENDLHYGTIIQPDDIDKEISAPTSA